MKCTSEKCVFRNNIDMSKWPCSSCRNWWSECGDIIKLITSEITMEEYFTRADKNELDKIAKLKKRCENKIAYAERMLGKLYYKRKEAEAEFFCGIPIQFETEDCNMYGDRYELIVFCIDEIRILARVHPNAHESKETRTFIARLELYDHYHDKNPIYQNFKSKSQYDIKSFEDAKRIAQGFLKDFIHTI